MPLGPLASALGLPAKLLEANILAAENKKLELRITKQVEAMSPLYDEAMQSETYTKKADLEKLRAEAMQQVSDGQFEAAEKSLGSLYTKVLEARLSDWNRNLAEATKIEAQLGKTVGIDPAKLKALTDLLKQANGKKAADDLPGANLLLVQFEIDAKDAIASAIKPVDAEKKNADIKAREAFESEVMVEGILGTLPDDVDLTLVIAIMREHSAAVPKEVAAFGSYKGLDDTLKIKDEAERQKVLKGINSAMENAMGRQKRLQAALNEVEWPRNADDTVKASLQQSYREAFSLVMRMTTHIPESWMAAWTPGFSERVANLCKTPEEKKRGLDLAKSTAYNPKEQEKDLKIFRTGIEPISPNKVERADFYFTEFVAPADPAKLKEMYLVQDKLVKRAHAIRDMGGKLRDCEKVFEHIPKQWWPPEFVEELQAWRKTERALQRERIDEMMAKDKDGSALKTLDGCVDFVIGTLGGLEGTFGEVGQKIALEEVGTAVQPGGPAPLLHTGMTSSNPKELSSSNWMHDDQVVQQLALYIGAVTEIKTRTQEWIKYYKSGEMDKVKEGDVEAIFDFGEQLLKTTNSAAKVITTICKTKGVVASDSFMAVKFLPGLAIASCGIDLFSALKALAEHSVRTHQTRQMKPEAQRLWAEGLDEDGGAFCKTLENELGARKIQLAKDSVEVTAKSVELTGAIGEASGIGTAPGMAIKIVGKAISYGGKLVFTAINWSMASAAKKLIWEAQAGNPVARIQIFEDCALYAKMYIAVLVQEGHPLAKKFIEQRGIEEGDLNKSMAMKILREAMMEDAEQKDESTYSVADDVLGIAAKVPKKLKEASEAIAKKYRNRGAKNAGAYDAALNISAPVGLDNPTWQAAKKEGMKNHLCNEETGIGEAMEAAAKAKAKIDKAKPAEKKTAKLGYYDALMELAGAARSYMPLTMPQGAKAEVMVHAGMTKYVVQLSAEIRTELTAVENEPDVQLNESRENFKPATPTDLDAAEWKKVFKKGVDEAHLPDDDCGVETALKALAKATANANLKPDAKDKQKQRDARLAAQAAYSEVIKTMKAYSVESGASQGMRDYLTAATSLAATAMREFDGELFDTLWTWSGKSKSNAEKFSPEVWKETWSEACKAGVVIEGKGDGGLGKALTEVKAKQTAYDAVFPPPAGPATDVLKALAARKQLKAALAKVFAGVSAFVGGQKSLVKDINDYCTLMRTESSARMQALGAQQNGIAFGCPAKSDFSATEWKTVYAAAVKAGAVGADSAGPALEKALTAYSEQAAKVTAAKGPKKREEANKTKTSLGKIQGKVDAAQGALGENELLSRYIGQVGAHIPAKMTEIEEVLGGAGANAKIPAFAWNEPKWQAAKKVAIGSGLFDDVSTGFGKLIKTADASSAKWEEAKKNTKALQKAKDEAKAKAIADTEAVKNMAEKFKAATKHDAWKAYLGEWGKEAGVKLAALRKG